MLGWLFACDPGPVLDGGCALTPDNALRASCSFTVDPPAALTLTLDGTTWSSPEGPEHELTLWRMPPESTLGWVARAGEAERTGELTTGELPPLASLTVEHTGEPAPSDTMFLANCGEPAAVVLDPLGQVVWYQALSEGLPQEILPVGLTWTEDHTVLAVLDRHWVREFALDGAQVAELGPTPEVIHHDVFRRDGYTWVLNARPQTVDGTTYVVDGFYRFDPEGEIDVDWELSQIATPSGPGGIGGVYWGISFPGAQEWAHSNGLWVTEDHDLVWSMHTFSTVVRLEGDPSDPAFGTPEWVLDGSGTSPWASTFSVVDPSGVTDDDGFGHQHHPTLEPDGTLRLFDNGESLTDVARALELSLDPGAGTATITGSWSLPGAVCPIEGAAFRLPDGDLLVTCALTSTYYRIAAADGEILGSTRATCEGTSGFNPLPRAIPVDLTP
ncbi:MAG: aryl-sulfate sulfotransferase [Myxococcota bacterium]